MSLDSRIRDAVDETLTAAVDVDQGLVALRRTRRQRTATRAGACVVVVALVVTGVLLRRHDTSPEPAPNPEVHNGIVLSLSLGGAVEQVSGTRLEHLPQHVKSMGPFQFTPDGQHLIYAADRVVVSRDLRTGEDQALLPCPRPQRLCVISLDPSGTMVASGHGSRLTVRDLTSGERRHFDIGSRVGAATWSADGTRLAFVSLHAGHESFIVLDLRSGDVTRSVELPGGLFVLPALSPDGGRLAYLRRVASGRKGMPHLELVTVPSTGGPARVLHAAGRCYCIRYFPAVTWSPDGKRIAVTMAGYPLRAQVGGAVYTVNADGSEWQQLRNGFYQDRLAWQPVFRPVD